MKKDLLPPVISFVAILAITHGEYASPLVNLLVAGVIPGTTIVLPFWVMIAFYCLTITAIITMYVEGTLHTIKTHRASSARKRQLPHRRYSNI